MDSLTVVVLLIALDEKVRRVPGAGLPVLVTVSVGLAGNVYQLWNHVKLLSAYQECRHHIQK